MAGRKATPPVVANKPVNDAALVAADLAATDDFVAAQRKANEDTLALAVDLHYEGTLTVPALEDEIRFYKSRAAEAVLEMGKRLMLLKQLSPHGEFGMRVETLGITPRMARRFMAATEKFLSAANSPLMALPGITQTKLLELVVLDDEEIKALEEVGMARGVTLDDIDCMSTSELRQALRRTSRDLKEAAEAKEAIKVRKDERINALEDELGHRPKETPAMQEQAVLLKLQAAVLKAVNEINLGLRGQMAEVTKHFEDAPLPNHVTLALQQGLSQAIQAAQVLAGDFGLTLGAGEHAALPPVASLAWLTEAEKTFGQPAAGFVLDAETEA